MAEYKWITDGVRNSRIPVTLDIPEGWRAGVTRKRPKKVKPPKYGRMKDWNRKQKEASQELQMKRLKDLEEIDLNKWGAITRLAEKWGVSRAQAKRYLAKLNEPART